MTIMTTNEITCFKKYASIVVLLSLHSILDTSIAFTPHHLKKTQPFLDHSRSSSSSSPAITNHISFRRLRHDPRSLTLSVSPGGDDNSGDEAGMNLAAEFSEMLKRKGIAPEPLDLDDDEEEDDGDDDDDDDSMRDIPRGELNVFSGRDDKGVGKLAGNVTITNKELYDTLKERCLESPASFAKLTRGDDDDDDDGDENDDTSSPPSSDYRPVDPTPDSDLTAGEVVTLILDALRHNDVPEPNHGVKVLFAYSGPASILKAADDKAPTVEEYADFLQTSEYEALLDHEQVIVDKADYSYDGRKAFYNVRLRTGGEGRNFTSVNFILSTKGHDDDDCWLVDSIIIRAEGMGRSRRRR